MAHAQRSFSWWCLAANQAEEPKTPIVTFLVEDGYDLASATTRLQAALLARDVTGGLVYQQAHRLVRIVRGLETPDGSLRTHEAPAIAEASPAWVRALAQRAVEWVRFDTRRNTMVPVLPPWDVITTLLAWKEWEFPPLIGIIGAPTLRADGTALTAPGYDPATYLYLDSSLEFPPLPDAPTRADAQEAVSVLSDVLSDFPFAAQHDRSAALAALLTLVCRPTLGEGCTPLFGITATTRASGKGLLCDVLALIATGRTAPKWAPMPSADEERKSLFALALEGGTLACLDNCAEPLGSPALDSAITATSIEGRILGKSETHDVPWRLVLFATGNNLRYKGDMARRVIPIALDPKMEHPEERADFKRPHLLEYVRAHRPELVMAALTIVRAYVVAGKPDMGVTPFGSFEAWSTVIRQALIWTGLPDPCLGRKDVEDTSDLDLGDLGEVLTCWQTCYGEQVKTLSAVQQELAMNRSGTAVANQWDALHDALGSFDPRYSATQPLNMKAIGKAFSKHVGRIVDGRKLVHGGKDRQNKVLWSVKVHGPLRTYTPEEE